MKIDSSPFQSAAQPEMCADMRFERLNSTKLRNSIEGPDTTDRCITRIETTHRQPWVETRIKPLIRVALNDKAISTFY
jgi:hypothetical protein